jgi:hypothetical protein
MIKRRKNMFTKSYNYFTAILLSAAIFILAGCSGSGTSTSTNGQGAVTAKLVWKSNKAAAKSVASAPTGVAIVRLAISGPGMTPVQNDFPAADGRGTLSNVPVGSGLTVTASGLDSSGVITYQGSVSNKVVTNGQTTDVGTITMLAVSGATPNGTDTTAPIVSETGFVAGNGTIDLFFVEPMDPSTITNGNITLVETSTGTPVSGTVSVLNPVYAVFTPSSSLTSSTNYTITISTGVKDVAGNAMASPYVSTFTTAAATTAGGGGTAPDPCIPTAWTTTMNLQVYVSGGITSVAAKPNSLSPLFSDLTMGLNTAILSGSTFDAYIASGGCPYTTLLAVDAGTAIVPTYTNIIGPPPVGSSILVITDFGYWSTLAIQ